MKNLSQAEQAEVEAIIAKRVAEGIAAAKVKGSKLSFKVSDKGVIVASFGPGFPMSGTVERWQAILASKEFAAFVQANSEGAKELRKNYTQTDEYKANAAKIQAERAAYSAKLKLA